MVAHPGHGTSKIISSSWLAVDASWLRHLCSPPCDISAIVRLDRLSYCMMDALRKGAMQKDKPAPMCKCLSSSASMTLIEVITSEQVIPPSPKLK